MAGDVNMGVVSRGQWGEEGDQHRELQGLSPGILQVLQGVD
jgi:hypothetical protein